MSNEENTKAESVEHGYLMLEHLEGINTLDAEAYRAKYKIFTIEDCSCVAEEAAAGFVMPGFDQLELPL